jgi:hypothetical protein
MGHGKFAGRDAQRAGNILLGQYADMHDPEHVRHQNLLSYCDKLEEQGGFLLESVKKISKRNQGVGQDLSEMVPVFEALSQSETHGALAQVCVRRGVREKRSLGGGVLMTRCAPWSYRSADDSHRDCASKS